MGFDADGSDHELQLELEESVQKIRFIENPEEQFGTGLIFPEEEELFAIALESAEPMEKFVAEGEPAYGRRFWYNDKKPYLLNQGRFGACTGFSAANLLNCSPINNDFGNDMGFFLYDRATHLDPFPSYFDSSSMVQHGSGGSTMQAVAKALVEQGHAVTFGVTQSIDTMARWVLNHGPALVGMPWGGCFEVDEGGYVHPDGSNGGHATCIRAIVRGAKGQVGPDRIRDLNNWGNWGLEGECRITLDELPNANPTFICIAEVA